MMKFHLSFFDFCAKNQPKAEYFGPEHDQIEPFLLSFGQKSKPAYFESSKGKSHWHQELQSVSVQYNNFFQCRSSMTGFKKTIYNRAKLVRNQLYPSYNRRKYHISHYNQIQKQCTRLSRTYGYLSQKKINHFIAFAFKPDLVTGSQRLPGSPIAIHKRHCVKMIHLLESQLSMVMYRCLFSNSIQMARQELAFEKKNHGKKSRFDNKSMLETQNQNHLFPGQLYRTSQL